MEKDEINAYVCSEGHELITKKVDEGRHPMTMTCRHCAEASVWGQVAYSQQGDHDQDLEHTHEWYAPAHPERIFDHQTRLHCQNGGLLLRKVGEGDYTLNIKVYTPSNANAKRMAALVQDAIRDINTEPFICEGCGHELDRSYSLRSANYCLLCDPAISVQELLDWPISPENHAGRTRQA
jgi:hypothetical protein